MNNVLINCVALSKAYKQAEEKLEVLKNLNFTVKKGESVGLIGASGCGKSTLLHVLAGLDLPDSGEVNFNDSNISYFSILYDLVLIGIAVPKVSILFSNIFSLTVVTIIPGGCLLPNFFSKCIPIIVLATMTPAIIKKNIIIIEVILVDLFILIYRILPKSHHKL